MNYMGNNQIKKRAAEQHNRKRKEADIEKARIKQDKIDNPEKYKPKVRRKVQASASMAIPYGENSSTGEPKLIHNWEELSKVTGSETYYLDITPEDGNGWIKDEEGNIIEYLSTHTFYGLNYEYSTRLLQTYGFNVILTNWDKNNE